LESTERSQMKNLEQILVRNSPNATNTFEDMRQIYLDMLNTLAPSPQKISICGNNRPHKSKDLREAIMKSSRLKRIANITDSDKSIKKCKRQKGLVVKMNK